MGHTIRRTFAKSMTYRTQTFVVGIIGLWAIGVPLHTGVAFNITLTVINTGVFLLNEILWRRTGWLKPKEEERVGQTSLLDRQEELTDKYSLVAEQFGSPILLRKLREEFVPDRLKDYTTIPEIVKWFQGIMKWSKDPELKRFNTIPELLETLEGRCGEWAILFTAVLCSLGYTARLILDFEDHVWTEVWTDNRWVQVDSTLEPPRNFDHPYIYQDDFKHKIVKILAFAPGGFVEDVTERYRHGAAETKA